MKRLDLKKITGALIAAALISTPVFAQTDFSQYTTEQLANMRTTVKTMPVQERKAFMKEWQKRMMAMTPQQRQQYMKQMQQQMQMQNGPNGPNLSRYKTVLMDQMVPMPSSYKMDQTAPTDQTPNR